METKRVLLVDDDVDFLEVNKSNLEKAGYGVVTAQSGRDGFRLATESRFDLAVLDVMMETRDEGFELARRLRHDERSAKIPLIMLTAVNDDNRTRGMPFSFSDKDRDEMWLPVDRFVDKPVSAERLVTIVRELAG